MFGFLKAIPFSFGLKTLKYFVDSTFRDKVKPIPGSVLYCDLWLAVEHSGIYVEDRLISNIVVDAVADSSVRLSSPRSFTSKSLLGQKIYVSCNAKGPVGHQDVAWFANQQVGERSFYGLVIKNCHQFSTKCITNINDNPNQTGILDTLFNSLPGETWEPTMATLKKTASKYLGANKWRLWDWENQKETDKESEPDWDANSNHFKNLPLNDENIARIRQEHQACLEYLSEIADENIPQNIQNNLLSFQRVLSSISTKYDEVKNFLAACPGANFTFSDLENCTDDFTSLAKELSHNETIKTLVRKMGRDYISEEMKKNALVPQVSRNEVHGTHRSNDLMRMLPSELLNLEDETLEVLFYSRLLEKSLITYELSGSTLIAGQNSENQKKRTGPVVACLDTSSSMSGKPMLKAKALLLAIGNILKKENRSLHVILFGSKNEILEFSMDRENNAASLLKFLQNSFNGGTDFQTPLERALEIIGKEKNYLKADILMISDGDCGLSSEYASQLQLKIKQLDCSIYSVLCAGARSVDTFSNEILVI